MDFSEVLYLRIIAVLNEDLNKRVISDKTKKQDRIDKEINNGYYKAVKNNIKLIHSIYKKLQLELASDV